LTVAAKDLPNPNLCRWCQDDDRHKGVLVEVVKYDGKVGVVHMQCLQQANKQSKDFYSTDDFRVAVADAVEQSLTQPQENTK
jgi:hypothetical protein